MVRLVKAGLTQGKEIFLWNEMQVWRLILQQSEKVNNFSTSDLSCYSLYEVRQIEGTNENHDRGYTRPNTRMIPLVESDSLIFGA